ncbi:hypothetical protein BU24DRAFT_202877 [Aaosphaeria arxii CBS 175.79]|uniref:Polycomb protein VEFS-Box domain-containing protein n=1 Tax=Aaosphaeria arxii CBS 175.79 TaxID=1450172 RepID=A0A6A5XT36_9PLEO|nr:uncharacterized protein BU24DRAFT_202877 [Aaosphaeria arxii CBS 175.79]KAF2016495.1 hypothetical protein BU24DRAFT_202877 [Aaosphaeria arxii CBS 175.79]
MGQTKIISDGTGSILTSGILSDERRPAFLNRNLKQALKAHQAGEGLQDRNQSGTSTSRPRWDASPLHQPPWTNDKSNHLRYLDINLKGISSVKTINSGKFDNRGALPNCFAFDVNIDVSIRQAYTARPFYFRTIAAQLHVTLFGGVTSIIINQRERIRVRGAELKPFITVGDGGHYAITATLRFSDPEHRDMESFLKFADLEYPLLKMELPSRLQAMWHDVKRPAQPKRSIYQSANLPLFSDPHSSIGFELRSVGLALQMELKWVSRAKSTLEDYMQTRKSANSTFSFTRPPARNVRSRYELSFDYWGRTVVLRSLMCLICGRYEFGHIDDLRLHLDCVHISSKYSWRLLKEVNGTQYWQCKSAHTKATRRDAIEDDGEDRPLPILAPRRPFSQTDYLENGDDSWQKQARQEMFEWEYETETESESESDTNVSTTEETKETTRPQSKATNNFSRASIYRQEFKATLMKPVRSKKKYKVPPAPAGTTFFRSRSKRILKTDEEISESEDDIDTDWLRLKTEAEITRNRNIPEAAKRFLKGWNAYLQAERPQSDLHFRDTLIRFAHFKGPWMQKEGLIGDFATLIQELRDLEIITSHIHNAAMTLATDVRQNHGPRRRTRKSSNLDYEGDIEMLPGDDNASSDPIIPENGVKSQHGKCLCGRQADVHKRQPVIYCESIYCLRHAFHISCVVQAWKPNGEPLPEREDWYCKDCEEDPDNDTGYRRWYS